MVLHDTRQARQTIPSSRDRHHDSSVNSQASLYSLCLSCPSSSSLLCVSLIQVAYNIEPNTHSYTQYISLEHDLAPPTTYYPRNSLHTPPHHTSPRLLYLAMPPQLLPASAAAFAPRASSVNVVLSSKVEPWLTQTLKRINRIKRPLNSVPQHQRCLTETLSSANAIWTLTSLMLQKAPEADLRKDSNPLVEGLFNYSFLHVEAYIVHVDMVLRNEVAFKLTPDSIESLIEHHKDVHCIDISANTYNWSEKEQQVKKLHEEFIQSINKFVYRTHVSALEGLEEDGAGELLCGKSEEVKNNIMNLFLPLLPPPPRVVDVVRPPTLLPSSPATNWWSQPSLQSSTPAPVDSWRVLPSSPSTTSSSDSNSLWASMSLNEIQLPSPAPSFSQPYSTAGMYYSSPQVTASIPALPLPSMLAQQQCGMGFGGFGGFGWERGYQDYAMI